MGTIGKRILRSAVGLLLAAGVPYVAATTVHADPGSGSGQDCPCGEKGECGHGKGCDCGGHKGMHGKEGGHMHGGPMAGGGPMKEGMTRHMEEMRGTIAKLRALEAKMGTMEAPRERRRGRLPRRLPRTFEAAHRPPGITPEAHGRDDGRKVT